MNFSLKMLILGNLLRVIRKVSKQYKKREETRKMGRQKEENSIP